MEKELQNNIQLFGLIGKNISYSFSAGYFAKKFTELELSNYHYRNFDLETIEELKSMLAQHPNLQGFNVTIPYKEKIIPLLDFIDPEAASIGAVNTVKIKNNRLEGFNTDCYGFEASISKFLKPSHTKALLLGTGGASKAVAYALAKKSIDYQFVSRKPADNLITYHEVTPALIDNHPIIINCTPLGTYPNINDSPDIPYSAMSSKHLLYDLIYNPEETSFLKQGKKQGATICNGLSMLELQAEKAWEIWTS
ncbi:shikimate dehydrogenase [Ascidiimonas sp. W6]|uniref:shikimate dehydrogenase family protein n=1 Tax=Ascidiimonas meishanensis TaxID=3128903 RepID=UPI0030EC1777